MRFPLGWRLDLPLCLPDPLLALLLHLRELAEDALSLAAHAVVSVSPSKIFLASA